MAFIVPVLAIFMLTWFSCKLGSSLAKAPLAAGTTLAWRTGSEKVAQKVELGVAVKDHVENEFSPVVKLILLASIA